MNYLGIDIHKRYSVCAAEDERGQELGTWRVEGNRASGFASILESLGGKWTVVLEACWSWERVYEQLESLGAVEEIVLANALQTRLIAQAQVKTDKVDARALARLLRGGLIPRVHVPAKAVRQRKAELRQRLYWARLRTRVRNRLHALLDRHPDLPLPACSDLFGVAGMKALKELHLPLYMAAMVAIVHNRHFKDFYQHLLQAGKLKKVALIAVMRKLACLLNHLLKNPHFALAD